MFGGLKRKLEKRIMNELLRKWISPVLRHGLTVAAGWLAAKGLLSGDDVGQFVDLATSVALAAGALAWSWWQKQQQGRS